ncbi:XrtA system polysaccharide chain length determinant [Sphingomonas sp. J315]|uniref:XrtA system polysaccharide chain length determinant n=1 Tax=Sphingomonas sp. J315 TaxID=2898433 RepID=UPI0021ADE2AB|nr:XrtA system polysaccharide chain length determinant [Sphingomonas sp. J315]UUX99757.1 chain-length determining protein [Sphingomonas sp. J315]
MGGLWDEIRTALHGVWQRRWIAMAVAWAVCLAGWLVVSQIPNQYESRARVFVQLRSILPGEGIATQQEQQKDIDRVRTTLASATNLEKVVRGTDLANTVATDRDVADRVAGLQKKIKITAQQDNLFEITATADSGKLSRTIVQKLIDIFVEDNLGTIRDEASQSLQFLDQQLAQRQKALQEAEAKKADFQTRYLGSLPGTGTLAERLAAARAQLAQVNQELAAAQSGLAAVNGQMAGTSATVAGVGGGGAVAGPARARLSAIQGQLAEARARLYRQSPRRHRAQEPVVGGAERGATRAGLFGRRRGASANPLYLSLRAMQADKSAQVAALTNRKAQIEADMAAIDQKIAGDPAAAQEQAEIDRNYQVMKAAYDKLLADREQVKLRSQAAGQADAVKFNVIDPPTAPRSPTAPNRPLLLTGVLIVGLGAGVAVAFGLSQLAGTFPTTARLEKMSGMPVIGSIGEVVTGAQTALRRKRFQMFAAASAGLVVAWVALLGLEMLQRGMSA